MSGGDPRASGSKKVSSRLGGVMHAILQDLIALLNMIGGAEAIQEQEQDRRLGNDGKLHAEAYRRRRC